MDFVIEFFKILGIALLIILGFPFVLICINGFLIKRDLKKINYDLAVIERFKKDGLN